jgi:alpha-amylase
MKPLVLFFHIHQPRRLRRVGFLDIGTGFDYFNDALNEDVIQTIARRCYLPVTAMLTKLCRELPNVKMSFSISGVALKQLEKFAPEVIENFRKLIDTGCVEVLGETSHHSLASVMPNDEFPHQVQEHSKLVERHFGVTPTVFRNTALIYNNNIGARVAQIGFKGVICEDVDEALMHKSHYATYQHPTKKELTILLRNNTFSDDISFRYISGTGKLDLDRYFRSIESAPGIVTLGIDFETFGEHQPESTGIISFLEEFITKASNSDQVKLMTPSDVLNMSQASDQLDIRDYTSWADESKDLSAWLDNEMQHEAFAVLQGMEGQVRNSNNQELLEIWRNLQTSDHFYYMSTKAGPDGEVHAHFSPYNSPYEAFINYMNILHDFKLKLQQASQHDPMETVEFERRHEHGPVWAEKAQADYLNSR